MFRLQNLKVVLAAQRYFSEKKMLILLILNAFLFCKVFFECSLGFPMGDDVVQFLETPEKSELDNKLYR